MDRDPDRYSRRGFGEGEGRNYERSAYDYRDQDPWGGRQGRPSYGGREESGYGGARNFGAGWDSIRGGYGGGLDASREGYRRDPESRRRDYGGDWERGRERGRDFGARWEAGRGPSGGWGLGQDPYRGSGAMLHPDWGQEYRRLEYGPEDLYGERSWEGDRGSWEGDRERTGGRGRPGGYYGIGPKGYKRSDERIREDLCERLCRSSSVDSREVTVTVREGEVTLSGTVPERWMKYQIETIADDTMCVKDVNNNIRVQRAGEESGREQTSATRTATTQGTTGQGTKQ